MSEPINYPFLPISSNNEFQSWLWLGLWSLGGEGFGPSDLSESRNVLEAAFDAGIRCLDTASFYAQGKSNALLTPLIKKHRKHLFISAKGGLLKRGNTVHHDGSSQNLRETLVTTLTELNTTYLDLYSLHWIDPKTPVTESISALKALQKEGLIRYWGIGNFSQKDIDKYIPPFSKIPHQIVSNPLCSHKEVIEASSKQKQTLNMIISPFQQGLLINEKYHHGSNVLGKKDVRRRMPLFKNPIALKWCKEFIENVKETSFTPAQCILLWLASKNAVDAVIIGSRTCLQLQDCLKVNKIITNILLSPSRESELLKYLPESLISKMNKGL